jgi:hypothetical protein
MSRLETHVEDPCDGVTKGTQTTGDPCNPILTNPFDKDPLDRDPVSPYQPSGGSLCQNVPAPTGSAGATTITTAIISHLIHEIVSGCTDSSASNYNPNATTDDGSCTYASATWLLKGSCIDGAGPGDASGNSVSLSADGTIVAIGSLYANYDHSNNQWNSFNNGHVRVYNNVGGSWSQIGQDIVGEAENDMSGVSVSLSDDGTIVAIGAYGNDGNGSNSGHVRVYQNVAGSWVQIGSDINGEAVDDQSGYSVSLSSDGSTVAIGAYTNDGVNGTDSGHVRVFQNVGGSWSQIGSDIDGEAAGDWSGRSVSLSADGATLAIGAIQNHGSGAYSGHVRVYQNVAGSWSQIGSDIDGEAAEDLSGASVSLSSDGTTVAIGAHYNDGTTGNIYDNRGHVRVFQNVGGSWSQIGSDIDGEAGQIYVNGVSNQPDESGWAISLSGDGGTLAIGARYNNGNGNWSGHVRVYQNVGGNWIQIGQDVDGEADGDQSGYSVSLSDDGSILAIGAWFNDGNGNQSGHTCVYHWLN